MKKLDEKKSSYLDLYYNDLFSLKLTIREIKNKRYGINRNK
jgi:hypothetical protein